MKHFMNTAHCAETTIPGEVKELLADVYLACSEQPCRRFGYCKYA